MSAFLQIVCKTEIILHVSSFVLFYYWESQSFNDTILVRFYTLELASNHENVYLLALSSALLKK